MWIQATNTGPGMFLFSIPTSDPVANFNPPVAFMDTGSIIALTNGTSVQTLIGNWGSLAGTVMTNTLMLNYVSRTFSYSLNGQTLATLPLGDYFTNVVEAIYFNGFERSTGSLGNRFAIDDVTVQIPQTRTSISDVGVRTNGFGFNINGTSELAVVVEASTNLANPLWTKVATNTITGGVVYFGDSNWTNYPRRFYRISSP